MPGERIEVISYSGYRGEETPRAFTAGVKKVEIIEILDRWIEEGLNDRTRKRFFKVKGSDGLIYRIYLDEGVDTWFMQDFMV
jgi:hypothetical protein